MSLVGLLIVLLGLGVGVWVGVIMKIGLPDTWKTERWWPLGDLNPRPTDYESAALTN